MKHLLTNLDIDVNRFRDEFIPAMIESKFWRYDHKLKQVKWGNRYLDGSAITLTLPCVKEYLQKNQIESCYLMGEWILDAMHTRGELNVFEKSKRKVAQLIKADPALINRHKINQLEQEIAEIEAAAEKLPQLKAELESLKG
jgi:hypothetical protein